MNTPATPSNSTDLVFTLAQVAICLMLLASLVFLFVTSQPVTDIHVSLTSLAVGYFIGGRAPASGVKQLAGALQAFNAAA